MSIVRDCDQCGCQFYGDDSKVVEECPNCGRMVNFILEENDYRINREKISSAASILGRKGGSVKSEAKTKANRENAKKGGWPKGRPRKKP